MSPRHNQLIKRNLLSALVLASTLVLDQITKSWAIHQLRGVAPQSFMGDVFRLEYAENPGAFLSLGAQLSENARFWTLTVAIAGFLLYCLHRLFFAGKMHPATQWGLALVIGGGASNLIDRISRTQGRVVDFMNLGIGSLRTGIFNVADIAIMVGVGLLIVELFKDKDASK